MKTISVIIPAYNREAYIAQSIESVLRQTYPVLEVIVVDDGSTDRTARIARDYGGKVRCISQANQWTGAARNAGIREACGELIAFLDSDDLWLERKLELQAGWLEADPELSMVFCRMKAFLSPEIEREKIERFDDREMDACNAQSMLAKRQAIDKLGAFPVERDIPEFLWWFARAGELGLKHATVPELLLLRRVHLTNGVSDAQFRLRYLQFVKAQIDLRKKRAAQ